MRLTNLAHLYRIRLRSRLVSDLLAVAGIAVGVALVFAALVANTSLTGSVRQLNEGLVGNASFQLAARSSDGFDQRLLGRVERIDGVGATAPIVEAKANLVGSGKVHPVLLIGSSPRFARFGGQLLQRLGTAGRRGPPGLGLPAPLATDLETRSGGKVKVETGVGTAYVRVAALLHRDDVGSLVANPIALAPLPLVQAAAGMRGRLSRIFVSPDSGRGPEVQQALERIADSRLEVAPADREVAMFERAAYPTNQSTAQFSVLSALVGFLFALSAMLLTVPQRRQLIAELRLTGYAPSVIVQILLFDALVLGVAGSALGLALGDQVSRHLFGAVPDYLTSAFPVGSQRIVTWQSVAVAGIAGVVAACIAVLAPVRQALLPNPSTSARGAAVPTREAWATGLGVGCLALTAAVVVFAPDLALIGVVTLTAALVLLLPVLLRLSASAIDSAGRRTSSPVAILAVLELRSGAARIRTLALAATGAIAVFATVSIGGANADLQRGLDRAGVEIDRNAEVWVTFRGPASLLGTTPFTLTSRQVERVERLAAVRSVHRYGGSFLDVGDHRAWVLAPPSSVPQPILETQIREGTASLAERRVRAGGWLVLSDGIAAQEDVGVGESIVLPTPIPTKFRVAALSNNNGWPGGAIVMNAADYARAWSTRATGALGIQIADGASPARVAFAVERALGHRIPVQVETRAERERRHRASSRAGLARLRQISAMVLISAVLAMAVAMGGVIWQRRSTISALKVHGFGEFELWRSLLLESGLLLGTGCLIGAGFGLAGQVLLDRGLEEITGFPLLYSTAGWLAVAVFALVTGVAVAMLAIPGWLAVRVRPIAGLAD